MKSVLKALEKEQDESSLPLLEQFDASKNILGEGTMISEGDDASSVDVEGTQVVDRLIEKKKVFDVEKNDEQKDASGMVPNISFFTIICLTIIFSQNMVRSGEFTYFSSYQEQIGITDNQVNFVWFIGPLSAVFGRILIGWISDVIWIPYVGRRKPFLFLGTVALASSLFFFSWSYIIAGFFFPNNVTSAATMTVVISLMGATTVELALNMLNASTKTLMIDVVPNQQQKTAVIWQIMFGLGSRALGGLVCFIDYINWFWFLGIWGTVKFNVTPAFTVMIICVLIAFLITFCCIHEKKEIVVEKLPGQRNNNNNNNNNNERGTRDEIHDDDDSNQPIQQESEGDVVMEAEDEEEANGEEDEDEEAAYDRRRAEWNCCWRCLTIVPWTIPCLYIMRFVLYTTYATKVMYFGVFCGRVVFGGDPDGTAEEKEMFSDGVRWAGLIIFVHLIFCTMMVPFLGILQRIRVRVIWGLAEVLDIIGFIIIFFVRNKWVLMICYNLFFFLHEITVTYYPNVMFNMIIKSKRRLKNRKGIINAVYSTSNVFPKVGLALLGGLIVDFLCIEGKGFGLGMGGMMLFAAIWCVFGLIIMLVLPVNDIFGLG